MKMLKNKSLELSCIIITLNEEKHLPLLLESIKMQTLKNFEIIVSDFNSKDNTRKIAKSYGCKIVLGGKHAIARNNGAKAARGKYLLFLDADCTLKNEKFLEMNLKKFKKSNKGIASAIASHYDGSFWDYILYGFYGVFVRIIQKFSPHGTGACILVKKNVFFKNKGFNESVVFAEDHEILKRIGKKEGFLILPCKIHTSTRRLKKEGRLNIFIKFIYAGIYRLFYKEIDKELFKYKKT